jgi:hypothetical protein
VADPVILRNTEVSVYEIPMEKIKLPMDEGVNVRDLGVDDNDGPIGTNPVEMATPAPNQKVWPGSDVNRVNPMLYDKAGDSTYMSTDGSMTIPASAVVSVLKIPPYSLTSTTRMISCITAAGVVS